MTSKTIRALACALLLETTICQHLNLPSVTDGACDLGTLPARVREVDGLCCFEAASNPGARCARGVSCDVPCAEKFLPFLGDCHPMIDKIFDSDDGIEDGIAAEFDSVFDACMAIDPAEALAALTDLKASGRCTDAQLDGVGETAVGEAPCVDERLGCPHLIASGFMTCAADFGPTGDMPGQCDRTCAFCDGPAPPAPPCDDVRTGCSATLATGFVSCEADFCPTCPMANQCDKTCNLCSGRHRLQSARQCDLAGFADRATAVDRACCDDGVSCSAGVPTTCDAKCAVVFAPFFDSCSAILATQVDRESFGSYQRLHDTCATGLPTEALLQAAAACSTSVPCPALPPLAGASIAYSNGLVAPSVATYTCDGSGGPPQDGDATRTCQADGSWSGSAPTTCAVACGAGPADCMTDRGCRTPGGRCIAFTCGAEAAHDQCARFKGAGWRTVTLTEHFEGGFCEDIIEHMWQPRLCTGHNMCAAGNEGCTSVGGCTGISSAFYVTQSGDPSDLRYVGPQVGACSNNPCNHGQTRDGWGPSGGAGDSSLRMLICIKE